MRGKVDERSVLGSTLAQTGLVLSSEVFVVGKHLASMFLQDWLLKRHGVSCTKEHGILPLELKGLESSPCSLSGRVYKNIKSNFKNYLHMFNVLSLMLF